MFAMGPAFFKQGGNAALAISGTFAAATVGAAYSSSIPISGGLEPYALTGGTGVASGALDSGFSLSITGTAGARFLTLSCASPATADTMTFTASVDSSDAQTATSVQSVVVSAASYHGAVLAHAPLRYWKLDEASGTVATDSSGNGGHGTYQGAYTQATPSLLPGGSGKSWTKTGSGAGRVQLPFASTPFDVPLSVVVWVKPSAYSAGASVIFGGSASAFQLALDPAGYPIAGRAGAANYTRASVAVALSAAHMIGISISGGVGTYTVDGVAAGTFTGMSAPPVFQNLNTSYLGLYLDGASFVYQGALQNVALFPSALSVADMAALFAAA